MSTPTCATSPKTPTIPRFWSTTKSSRSPPPDEILAIPEAGSITIRGFVPVIKTAAMLVFHNQASFVNVAVGRVGEEYQNTDYEKFNKSLCQFMDSIEIMMHLPPSK